MYYIGIDLGTSAVKLLLMQGDGQIANIVSREYPIAFPHPGWSEQNPADWWDAVRAGIPELLNGFDASQVAGIGAGGQMHGLVVLDAQDKVIRPCILWNDGRTQKQVEYLNNVIGKENLSKYTANIAFAGFTAPKLLWMRDTEPENFAKISKIMLPKDYINYKLTGVHCTDYSDASGMLLLDVQHKRWSKEMLDICGVSEAQVPKLFESWEPVGTLTAEAAAKLGLPEGVKVCAGAGDNAAAAVGCGAVGNGKCNISLGTSGTVFITSSTFGVDKQNALHSFDHADGGYHLMGCILSAASCNKWWMEDILNTQDFGKEQEPITAEKLGANDVYYLPYLMGVYLDPTGSQIGKKESIADTARVLGRMYEGIEYRGFGQDIVEELAKYAGVPVWNGLTNEYHPTQMLADMLTIREHFGDLKGRRLVYMGDARYNMGNSLMIACSKLGMHFVACTTKKYFPNQELVDLCRTYAEASGGSVTLTEDVQTGTKDADVIYTDVWVSMGEPDEVWEERIKDLTPYKVTADVMKNAGEKAIFLHCLPAFHDLKTKIGKEMGERFNLTDMEVTDEVFESAQSHVFDEAENRMHTIKAVMVATLGEPENK